MRCNQVINQSKCFHLPNNIAADGKAVSLTGHGEAYYRFQKDNKSTFITRDLKYSCFSQFKFTLTQKIYQIHLRHEILASLTPI